MTIVVPVPIPAGPPVPNSGVAEPDFDVQVENFNDWQRGIAVPGMNALANAAYQNALDAKTSADSALGYRNEANNSKNAAADSAAAASGSAGTASTKAGEAAASSGIATGAAGAASASAISAGASAAAAAASALDAEGYAASVSAAPVKAVPNDADKIGGLDSTASFSIFGMNFGALKSWLGGFFYSKSGGPLTGDLNLSGPGRRITADFSNGVIADRAMIQTTALNSGTNVSIIPNGTVAASAGTAHLRFEDSTSIATGNGSFGGVLLTQDSDFRIQSSRMGTGAYLPLTTYVGGFKNTEQPTTGGLLITGGALGYGPGVGGTVAQPTSKSTAVAINRLSGQITMHNAALAAGASVTFTVSNSYITALTDLVFAHASGFSAYGVSTNVGAPGSFSVRVTNNSGASLSDAVVITFVVLKAATS